MRTSRTAILCVTDLDFSMKMVYVSSKDLQFHRMTELQITTSDQLPLLLPANELSSSGKQRKTKRLNCRIKKRKRVHRKVFLQQQRSRYSELHLLQLNLLEKINKVQLIFFEHRYLGIFGAVYASLRSKLGIQKLSRDNIFLS